MYMYCQCMYMVVWRVTGGKAIIEIVCVTFCESSQHIVEWNVCGYSPHSNTMQSPI